MQSLRVGLRTNPGRRIAGAADEDDPWSRTASACANGCSGTAAEILAPVTTRSAGALSIASAGAPGIKAAPTSRTIGMTTCMFALFAPVAARFGWVAPAQRLDRMSAQRQTHPARNPPGFARGAAVGYSIEIPVIRGGYPAPMSATRREWQARASGFPPRDRYRRRLRERRAKTNALDRRTSPGQGLRRTVETGYQFGAGPERV